MSEKNKTIEEKMKKLRDMTAWFESEDFALTQATKKFEAASKLAAEIEHDLSDMENQIQVLKQSFEEA
jgi:exodeoxyribonuclease VII small subunit